MDMGIPVVTWDSDAPKSKRIAFYGVNDFEGGKIMGENLVKLLAGKGQIAVMTALGADNLEQRLKGAMSILEKEPKIQIVEIFDCRDDYLVAKQIIEIANKRYPNLNGWLTVGGWPILNENALDPVDTARIKVVAFDTIPPAPAIMKKARFIFWWGRSISAGEPCPPKCFMTLWSITNIRLSRLSIQEWILSRRRMWMLISRNGTG
jgi:ribose transport system substrate-binding protein